MPRWQLFYHLVWAVQYREPLIIPAVEDGLYGLLRSKAVGLQGEVFALGGMADHVHMVAAIPPSVAVATFVGQIKGSSSSRLNRAAILGQQFRWQEEYAAFSLDVATLPRCIRYVRNQKHHHAVGTTIERFELAAPPPGDESPG